MRRRHCLRTCVLAIGIWQLTGPAAQPAQGTRTVVGTVFYEGGEPARNAAVQLEDRITLQVVSQLTNASGDYHFAGLSSDKDYEIKATRNGYWSKKETVSRFSSKAEVRVDFHLKPGKEPK